MNVLIWMKRDLRTEDHPALAFAATRGRVLPVYVAEPEYWRLPDTSGRQWAFVASSLAALRDDLAQRGLPLVVRTGDAVEVLDRLCRTYGISEIVSHEETGNLWTYARDRRVGAWARGRGIRWTEVPQCGVVRRLARRDGWAARRDAFMAADPVQPQGLSPVPGVEPGAIPTARSLGLADDPCPHMQAGGRARGLVCLDSFLTHRGAPYRSAMSSPLTAERACSRLSPHIALGTLSVREVVQATARRQSERPPAPWGPSLSSFQSRLAWRDHFMQKLEDDPEIECRALHVAADSLRDSDAARLQAWALGETGIPFLDACMRYLRATGWLNFRMRAMVMACASYHLWLDWRQSGAVLARLFTDYEPGIHWPQVQMQSGVTAINRPRIYNPVKQGLDQDPTGAFIRRWLPELAEVPETHLHAPWRWSGAARLLGRRYPEPIVDVAAAARAARETIYGLRRTPGFAEERAEVLERHGSRMPPRSRTGTRGKSSSAQLSLDL